jgi:hypothetical protein
MAFSGSGLLLAYFHGIASWLVLAGLGLWYRMVPTFPALYQHGEVTYIRDHFFVDNLELSGISGGGEVNVVAPTKSELSGQAKRAYM